MSDTAQTAVLLLGLASSAAMVTSALGRNKKVILGAALGTSGFLIIQAFILNVPATGAALMVGIVRNLLALLPSRLGELLNHWWTAPVYIAAHLTIFFTVNDFTHFQWWQVIPLTSGLIAVTAPYFPVIPMKIMFGVGSASWLVYEFSAGMYTQMLGQGTFFILNLLTILTLIRIARARSTESNKNSMQLPQVLPVLPK